MFLLLPIDDFLLKVCEEIPEATDSLEALGSNCSAGLRNNEFEKRTCACGCFELD
jgi:hypothetical protein